MIDIHSHVLPGIDDGSKSFDESLKILKGLAEQGITDLICTPHYIPETNQTSPRSANIKLLEELCAKCQEANLNIKLHLGNEIYIDKNITKYLRTKKISPLANSQYLLVELPMSGVFEQYEDILLNLRQKGWKIILAHPERYHSFQKDYSKAVSLAKQGILLQCNLGSFIGQYGKTAKKLAQRLAKDNLIYCFGTDIHHQRDYSEITKAKNKLRKYYHFAELDAVLVQNARKLL